MVGTNRRLAIYANNLACASSAHVKLRVRLPEHVLTPDGSLDSINLSAGGVPKLVRGSCLVRVSGLVGDRQSDLRYHGGPLRAVSLYSVELIQALQAEGHPIDVGSLGENLTIAGVAWSAMTPGTRVDIGDVCLRLTRHAHPCKKIAGSFRDGEFVRVSHKVHPGWSRLYASVTREGIVRVGDRVRIFPPEGGQDT